MRLLDESIEAVKLWSTVLDCWVRLKLNRWAEMEQCPMHEDRPRLALRINELEWKLRELGFDYLL